MEWKFGVETDFWSSGGINLYLTSLGEDYKSFYYTVKNGLLERHPKGEMEKATPLLSLNEIYGTLILRAMVGGLKNAGFVAEVDNKQRISAEAIASERENERDWLRKLVEKQLNEK